MLDVKFPGDYLGAFSMPAGYRDDLGTHTITEAWDLRSSGEPGSDDSYSNWRRFHCYEIGDLKRFSSVNAARPNVSIEFFSRPKGIFALSATRDSLFQKDP
jgi:hypothetical protein